MTIVITTQANESLARKQTKGLKNVHFVSPTEPRAVHGADKVIILGDYPKIVKQYTGICPVEVIKVSGKNTEPKEEDPSEPVNDDES